MHVIVNLVHGCVQSRAVFNTTSVPLPVFSNAITSFLNNYPLVLSRDVLTQEVPYLGGNAEMTFYVEGLRFPDKDFDGLISINLSVLEPISSVGFFFFIMLLMVTIVNKNI